MDMRTSALVHRGFVMYVVGGVFSLVSLVFIGLGVFISVFSTAVNALALLICFGLGAVALLVSMLVLWFAKKLGDDPALLSLPMFKEEK